MSTTIRVVPNRRNILKLLKEPGVIADLQARGERVRAAAGGDGIEVQTYMGRNRARVTVRTATWEARAREARDRNLTRAFGAAG